MTNTPKSQASDGVPTYLGRGAPPAGSRTTTRRGWTRWPATSPGEGSLLDGAVQGAEAVRAVIGGVRELYDRQDFNFAGPWGDNGFIEDYTGEVLVGRPLRGRPPDHLEAPTGEAQHIPRANYRPLSSVMLFTRSAAARTSPTPLTPGAPRRQGSAHDVVPAASRLPRPASTWRLPTACLAPRMGSTTRTARSAKRRRRYVSSPARPREPRQVGIPRCVGTRGARPPSRDLRQRRGGRLDRHLPRCNAMARDATLFRALTAQVDLLESRMKLLRTRASCSIARTSRRSGAAGRPRSSPDVIGAVRRAPAEPDGWLRRRSPTGSRAGPADPADEIGTSPGTQGARSWPLAGVTRDPPHSYPASRPRAR